MLLFALAVFAPPAAAHEWAAGIDAGYAFRSQADGRNHGAAAAAFVDVPLPFGPLALRPEVFSLGFGASKDAPRGLGLFAGALSLVYSFDDAEAQALASVGPFAGIAVDHGTALRAGALAALTIRVPVAELASLEAKVSLPAVIYGPEGVNAPGQAAYADGTAVAFPLQTTFQFGVAVDLAALASALL